MFKLTRINSARLFLSIIVIVIFSSTCVSTTLLLDPLSPGEFIYFSTPNHNNVCHWLRGMWIVCNQFKSIEITEMIAHLCAHFMHRFGMLLIEMSHLRIPLMFHHHRHTYINLSYFMAFLFYTRTECTFHIIQQGALWSSSEKKVQNDSR